MTANSSKQLELARLLIVEKVECPSQRLLLSLHFLQDLHKQLRMAILRVETTTSLLLQPVQQVLDISSRGVLTCLTYLSHLGSERCCDHTIKLFLTPSSKSKGTRKVARMSLHHSTPCGFQE